MVSAADLPCDIRDFRVEGATIKVFFSEKASWRVGSRGDRIIAGAKSLYFDEMQQDDVVMEEEGLTLGDGASVNLSIPHIVCTLTAVLEPGSSRAACSPVSKEARVTRALRARSPPAIRHGFRKRAN